MEFIRGLGWVLGLALGEVLEPGQGLWLRMRMELGLAMEMELGYELGLE